MHFNLDDPIPLARLAPPAFDIKTEPTRTVPAYLRIRQLGEQCADVVERAWVRCGIRPWRATDGRLINDNHLVEFFQSQDCLMHARPVLRPIEFPEKRLAQDVVHQRALARPAHPGYACE